MRKIREEGMRGTDALLKSNGGEAIDSNTEKEADLKGQPLWVFV